MRYSTTLVFLALCAANLHANNHFSPQIVPSHGDPWSVNRDDRPAKGGSVTCWCGENILNRQRRGIWDTFRRLGKTIMKTLKTQQNFKTKITNDMDLEIKEKPGSDLVKRTSPKKDEKSFSKADEKTISDLDKKSNPKKDEKSFSKADEKTISNLDKKVSLKKLKKLFFKADEKTISDLDKKVSLKKVKKSFSKADEKTISNLNKKVSPKKDNRSFSKTNKKTISGIEKRSSFETNDKTTKIDIEISTKSKRKRVPKTNIETNSKTDKKKSSPKGDNAIISTATGKISIPKNDERTSPKIDEQSSLKTVDKTNSKIKKKTSTKFEERTSPAIANESSLKSNEKTSMENVKKSSLDTNIESSSKTNEEVSQPTVDEKPSSKVDLNTGIIPPVVYLYTTPKVGTRSIAFVAPQNPVTMCYVRPRIPLHDLDVEAEKLSRLVGQIREREDALLRRIAPSKYTNNLSRYVKKITTERRLTRDPFLQTNIVLKHVVHNLPYSNLKIHALLEFKEISRLRIFIRRKDKELVAILKSRIPPEHLKKIERLASKTLKKKKELYRQKIFN